MYQHLRLPITRPVRDAIADVKAALAKAEARETARVVGRWIVTDREGTEVRLRAVRYDAERQLILVGAGGRRWFMTLKQFDALRERAALRYVGR